MLNLNAILGGIVAVALALLGGELHGRYSANRACEAETFEALAEAEAIAREDERVKQEAVNRVLQQHNANLQSINARLSGDLERLRNRPARPLPGTSGACSSGATGAELSRPDAEFLVGEAARAERLREALGACYAAYDQTR